MAEKGIVRRTIIHSSRIAITSLLHVLQHNRLLRMLFSKAGIARHDDFTRILEEGKEINPSFGITLLT